jgi:hypothetical protein
MHAVTLLTNRIDRIETLWLSYEIRTFITARFKVKGIIRYHRAIYLKMALFILVYYVCTGIITTRLTHTITSFVIAFLKSVIGDVMADGNGGRVKWP